MTIYVLVSNYLNVDSGDCDTIVIGVYSTYEQAQERMKQEMEVTRNYFEYIDTDENDFVEGDMSWSIWETGEYMSHHCDIIINECEVQ